jgi:hypothetical protein
MKTDIADRYTYRVTWSEDDREFVGLCAEFPSLSWLDRERDAALQGIVQLVRDALADLDEDEATPVPLMDRKYSGELRIRPPPRHSSALGARSSRARNVAEQGHRPEIELSLF